MNVVVYLNGTNISHHTVRYTTDHKICTGIGTLELALDKNFTDEVNTWDTITIYEEGDLTGTYYVSSVSYDDPEYSIVIVAQDGSKRLQDYFISDKYVIKYISTNIYWIEKFLTETGCTYQVEPGTKSTYLQEDTAIGPINAYEEILQLLQMGGLYIHFNESGVCIIGHLSKDLSNLDFYFDETDILNIHTSKDDKMLRNRAVVWGKGDPLSKNWVFADVSRPTIWDYDVNDKRSTLYSNPSIPNFGSANSLANKMLDEFAKITFTKELTVHGARGVSVGDIVFIETPIFTGAGLVTTAGTEMSKSGLITHIIVDERCPRLFDYFGLKDYVYVGMNGQGVWRKKIDEYLWEDYSTGITDLTITDLYKNNGILSCVTASGYLYRRSEYASAWSQVTLPGLPVTISGEETLITDGLKARSVTQDRQTNHIHAIVDNSSRDNRREYGVTLSGLISDIADYQSEYTWVVDVSPYNGTIIDVSEVTISGDQVYEIIPSGILPSGVVISEFEHLVGFDIDNDGKNDYVSVLAICSGFGPSEPSWNEDQYDFGINESQWYDDGGQVSMSGLTSAPGTTYTVSLIAQPHTRPRPIFTSDNKGNHCAVSAGGGSAKRYKLNYTPPSTYTSSTTILSGLDISVCYGIYQVSVDEYNILGGKAITVSGYSEYETTLWNVNFATSGVTAIDNTDYTVEPPDDTSRCGNMMYSYKEITDAEDNLYGLVIEIYAYNLDTGYMGLVSTLSLPSSDPLHWYDKMGIMCGHYGSLMPLLKIAVRELDLWSISGDPEVVRLKQETMHIYTWNGSSLEETLTQAGYDFPAPGTIWSNFTGNVYEYNNYIWGYESWGRQINTFRMGFSVLLYTGDDVSVDTWVRLYDYYPGSSWVNDGYAGGAVDNNYPTLNDSGWFNSDKVVGKSGSAWYLKDAISGAIITTFDQSLYTIKTNCIHTDVQGRYLFTCTRNSDSYTGTIFYKEDGSVDKFVYQLHYWARYVTYPDAIMNSESWGYQVIHDETAEAAYKSLNMFSYMNFDWMEVTGSISYIPNQSNVYCPDQQGGANIYCVLKKEEDNYDVVWSGLYNYCRLDISDGDPLVVVPSGEWGMGLIDTRDLSTYPSNSTDLALINDFRYTIIETTSGNAKELYYAKGVDLLGLNISDLTNVDWDGTTVEVSVASGVMGKVETSNHQLPYQYIFVSNEPVSGGPGYSRFWQSDPLSGMTSFIEYPDGLPSGLINIIRVDDRL